MTPSSIKRFSFGQQSLAAGPTLPSEIEIDDIEIDDTNCKQHLTDLVRTAVTGCGTNVAVRRWFPCDTRSSRPARQRAARLGCNGQRHSGGIIQASKGVLHSNFGTIHHDTMSLLLLLVLVPLQKILTSIENVVKPCIIETILASGHFVCVSRACDLKLLFVYSWKTQTIRSYRN